MERAILTFDLPEDGEAFDIHANAERRAVAMYDLYYEMYWQDKNGDYKMTREELVRHIMKLTAEYVS